MQHRTPGRAGITASPYTGQADMVTLTGLYRTLCAIASAVNVPVPAGTQPEPSAP